MTGHCPDWDRMLAHRDDPQLDPPAGWQAALSHLDHCDRCRREALDRDPLLVFQGAAGWEPDEGEVEAVRAGVDVVRRSRQLVPVATRRSSGYRWAAASLFVGSLLLLPSTIGRDEDDPWSLRQVTSAPAQAIDGLDRPTARVYEWGGEDLSVVMVVDESLDV